MTAQKIIGLGVASYVALVIFNSLKAGVFSFNVNPTEALFLMMANIGAGVVTDAIL